MTKIIRNIFIRFWILPEKENIIDKVKKDIWYIEQLEIEEDIKQKHIENEQRKKDILSTQNFIENIQLFDRIQERKRQKNLESIQRTPLKWYYRPWINQVLQEFEEEKKIEWNANMNEVLLRNQK